MSGKFYKIVISLILALFIVFLPSCSDSTDEYSTDSSETIHYEYDEEEEYSDDEEDYYETEYYEEAYEEEYYEDTYYDDYIVYYTDTGSKYHRYGCQYLWNSCNSCYLSEAQSWGLTPCSVCDP